MNALMSGSGASTRQRIFLSELFHAELDRSARGKT